MISMAAAACAAIWSVSRAVVLPHLMWTGPSRCMSVPRMVNDARVEATSQMAVSSIPPQYPPNMGICSASMRSPAAFQPATMFIRLESIFISFMSEHSCRSCFFRLISPRSAERQAALDSAVWGPYMHRPGRPQMAQASRM